MSVVVTGRVVSDDGDPLPPLRIEARADWFLTTELLATAAPEANGNFTLTVPTVEDSALLAPSSFRLRVLDLARRPVAPDKELAATTPNHQLGEISLPRKDVDGFLVTGLTGTPKAVTGANALKLLIDGEEAFGRIVEDIESAETSVNITQLFFPVPSFETKPADERPILVFRFGQPALVASDPADRTPPHALELRPDDVRPERLLLQKATDSADLVVRVLLNNPEFGWPEAVFWLVVGPPLAVGAALALPVGVPLLLAGCGLAFLPVVLAGSVLVWAVMAAVAPDALQDSSHVERLQNYFAKGITAAAPKQPDITVRGFDQPVPDQGVMHCKMVIVDGTRAVVIGSPFSQRYFDTQKHTVEEPRRGSNTSPIVHDVSIGIRGPAVRDLHETMCLFWNEDLDTDHIVTDTDPPQQTTGEDGLATVQVVRTLNGTRFDSLNGKSEKGILECYLRAFAAAETYIYLETQYFTDSVITDALISVLTEKPALELILVVNIEPDVFLYPGRQAKQIARIRKAGGSRVGVFTRWVCTDDVFSWVAPVYLHSKAAAVDDIWSTIGSANLDGLSLDHNLLLSPLVFGETTASEVNISVVEKTSDPVASRFSALVRRRLWAEHLGFVRPDGNPAPEHPDLANRPSTGWVKLWETKASAALQRLNLGGLDPLPGFVLHYPDKDAGKVTTPRKHLAAVGLDLDRIRPVSKTRGFDFFKTWWSGVTEEDKKS